MNSWMYGKIKKYTVKIYHQDITLCQHLSVAYNWSAIMWIKSAYADLHFLSHAAIRLPKAAVMITEINKM